MILDRLENWELYFRSPLMERVRLCLAGLTPDSPLGEREIQGRDAWVNLFEGALRLPEQARFESHRVYADVQMVVRGEERCGWVPREGLTCDGDYDPDKDVAFHRVPAAGAETFGLRPGLFVVFFPGDAHMPQLGGPGSVLKAVAKIRADLLK
ncbi:MAG TPA: YhcH/YjgK/YiaL family protein [Desulfovibrio sp.]|jgi:YhcH/YjgK/YiaL family protein|uniref:YhcH/YjgK/YiaL family protein n=1 Tax=Desulfovibrio TaxID=872 RepID=UPI002A4112E6|nr:YhcH/YjgK/YiaL family protein [Desulfovibrio sp.]MDY0305503.1 YhcH/YjgK/YiaL family protein [Desulfovibrionaceae bacterium]HMM39802.1 YhcH/YjgK/YiaL family protein [Desulfovibrio sp.]